MFNKCVPAALLAAAVFFAEPAEAITFDLAGNGGLSHSYTFGPIDGVGLTIVAGTVDLGTNPSLDTVNVGGVAGQYPQVGQYPVVGYNTGGLGVVSSRRDNSHQVDGSGLNDILLLSFTRAVRFVSATFSYVTHNDDFEFWFDNEPDGSLDGDYVFTADIPGSLTYVLAGNYVGNLFGLAAVGHNDDYKVRSVTVEAVAPVPLPAALPLLAVGVFGLGIAGWRRRRAGTA